MPSTNTRWIAALLEVAAAFGSALVFAGSCLTIDVDPLDRVGQVSALASLGLRFFVFGLALIVALVVASRVRGGTAFATTSRFVFAATAGLLSGLVAGGIMVALSGTANGLGGEGGDTAVLTKWAEEIRRGETPQWEMYPPLQIYFIVWISDVLEISALHAIKYVQIAGILMVTPAAYLAWRLVLAPVWALAIGVTASIPLIEPYRPYPFLVLIVFVPLAVAMLRELRRSADRPVLSLARSGVAFGLAFGVCCLTYSGWFLWSAPGFIAAAAIVFPWRRAPRKGLVLCIVAALVFAIVVARYAIRIAGSTAVDAFMHFDSRVDPAYITMWRGDLPGSYGEPGMWPPLGELGGVGAFTLLVFTGVGIAVALGRTRTLVIAVGAMLVGAWLLRYWRAHSMWDTKLVQLYPRTTAEILYCLLILVGCGVLLAIDRARRQAHDDSPLRSASGPIGALCGLLLVYGTAGSAISDRFMPRNAGWHDTAFLAWMAHKTPGPDDSQSLGAVVEVSSSHEGDGWSSQHLVDGNLSSGYSSVVDPNDREEWIIVRCPRPRTFSRVVLHPAADGFPIDFTIDLWDGFRWITRVTRTDQSQPLTPQEISFGTSERTNLIRITATRLGSAGPGRALQLREIELYR